MYRVQGVDDDYGDSLRYMYPAQRVDDDEEARGTCTLYRGLMMMRRLLDSLRYMYRWLMMMMMRLLDSLRYMYRGLMMMMRRLVDSLKYMYRGLMMMIMRLLDSLRYMYRGVDDDDNDEETGR